MPNISVVLPVYNGEAYLADSIESVLKQTYRDFELIIVDDGSSDQSSEIARHYARLDSRVIYFCNDRNLKLPASLNKGFSHAQGEHWTWTSCDNLYEKDALRCLLKALEENVSVGLVYAGMKLMDDQGRVTGLLKAGPAEDLILRNVVGACFLYRASVAKKIGGYNQDLFLCEDYEYWLRMATHVFIKPIPACLYQYRRHAKSLSNNREREIIKKGIEVQKHYYPAFVKSRKKAALFYAYLRDRDRYNVFRQFYLMSVFFYSPSIFFKEVWSLFSRRFSG